MNLLVTCHPSPASLSGQIAHIVKGTLVSRGRTLVHDDLYALGFDPRVSQQELATYHDRGAVPADVAGLAQNLMTAERLIFVFPTWMYGLPALMKGYFDRVWRPHIAFELSDAGIKPLLTNVRHLCAIACHGQPRSAARGSGDTTELFFASAIPSVLPNLVSTTRFDVYGLDQPSDLAISTELERIKDHFLNI